MIKLYGIFHLPTGEIATLPLVTQKAVADRKRYASQNRLDKLTKKYTNLLEHFNEHDFDEEYITKYKDALDYLNHCEVRELNSTMGAM